MGSDELARLIGRLKFGDDEQIRLKKLLDEGAPTKVTERVDGWLDDALRRIGECPPEVLAHWARELSAEGRLDARRKVEAIRTVVLAMDVFLEEAGRAAASRPDPGSQAPSIDNTTRDP